MIKKLTIRVIACDHCALTESLFLQCDKCKRILCRQCFHNIEIDNAHRASCGGNSYRKPPAGRYNEILVVDAKGR